MLKQGQVDCEVIANWEYHTPSTGIAELIDYLHLMDIVPVDYIIKSRRISDDA